MVTGGVQVNSLFYNLSVMVSARVHEAIQAAREGHKDEARHWFYFVEQTALVKILKSQGYDVRELSRQMIVLSDAVHPDSSISGKQNETQLARIADRLERLENFFKSPPAILVDWSLVQEQTTKN